MSIRCKKNLTVLQLFYISFKKNLYFLVKWHSLFCTHIHTRETDQSHIPCPVKKNLKNRCGAPRGSCVAGERHQPRILPPRPPVDVVRVSAHRYADRHQRIDSVYVIYIFNYINQYIRKVYGFSQVGGGRFLAVTGKRLYFALSKRNKAITLKPYTSLSA